MQFSSADERASNFLIAGVASLDAENAVETVRELANNDINIIFGSIPNKNLTDEVIVTVIATGFDKANNDEDSSDYGNDEDSLPKRRMVNDDMDLELDIPSFLRNRDDY